MLSAIQNDEYGLGSISFDKIIPMPPELDIECGRNKTDPQVIRNIQKYGAPDWYDWCREHWNTKWDAGGYEKGKDYSQCDKLAFWTAWQEPARSYRSCQRCTLTSSLPTSGQRNRWL